MRPAAVVVADERSQGAVACGAVRPDAAVCPFAVQGVPETLDLAVPARRVERREDVFGAQLGERGGKHPAAAVALGVVAHDGLDRAAALLAEPDRGAAQRGRYDVSG